MKENPGLQGLGYLSKTVSPPKYAFAVIKIYLK